MTTDIAETGPAVRGRGPALSFIVALSLAGCASLPASGPTARDIVQSQRLDDSFAIVDVDAATIDRLAASTDGGRGRLAGVARPGDVDAIGPGDVLQIAIYEIGAALFAGRTSSAGPGEAAAPLGGTSEPLPPVVVGRDGAVALPWAGRIVAAGRTPDQLGEDIRRALRGKSENPQVVVSVRENVRNTVIVQGDVKKPGRMPLTLAHERLLDAVAIAGGSTGPGVDTVVQLARDGRLVDAPLAAVEPGSADDVLLLPQDRIAVTLRPRTFTVLGASGKVAEFPFQNPRVSLAEALGRAGGPSEQTADAASVFVFRYDPAGYDGAPLPGARPTAYRINLRVAQAYLLAQRFEMRPRDVIVVANARANLPTKAIQILNLFFSPFYTARVLTQ